MKISLIFLTALLFSIPSMNAQIKHEININANDTFDLPELGAFITQYKDIFKVQFVAPENNRPAVYKNVDLRKDDIVMMVNGKTVKKVSDLHDEYDRLKTGEEFKLGIKRDKQMFILSIKKADPKDLPQRKMVIMDDKEMKNKVLLIGTGILIANINGKPMIDKMLRDDVADVKKAGLKGGDVVTQFNDQTIKTFNEFKQAYDKVKAGQEVKLRFGVKTLSIKKEKDEGMKIIRKEITK